MLWSKYLCKKKCQLSQKPVYDTGHSRLCSMRNDKCLGLCTEKRSLRVPPARAISTRDLPFHPKHTSPSLSPFKNLRPRKNKQTKKKSPINFSLEICKPIKSQHPLLIATKHSTSTTPSQKSV